MTWTAWRQQRAQYLAFTLVALLLAAWMFITGHHEQMAWSRYLAAPCHGGDGFPASDNLLCVTQQSALSQSWFGSSLVSYTTLAFVPLFGLVLGATAVAHDLQNKTVRLVLTQSQSRTRWLASKLLVNAGALVVVLVPLSLVSSWWIRAAHYAPRLASKAFPLAGPVGVTYALFGFALAVAFGLVLRRVGWTLAVGLVLVAALLLNFPNQVRPNLVSHDVASVSSTRVTKGSASGFYSSGGPPATALSLSSAYEAEGTKDVPSPSSMKAAATEMMQCEHQESFPSCESKLKMVMVQIYIPDSEFWTLQALEGLIYLALATLLSAGALVGVRRVRA